ncbi:MAG: aminoglycoside phosphotransferase family protein [Candidatus Pacebacteria bacterium]|nr:aminoglycoside phosphotransferase family protein [Candidatus Paceibacterota bacterium]
MQEKIPTAIHTVFPDAVVVAVLKFTKGLANLAFRVEILNPEKVLVAKFFSKKNEEKVEKGSQISNYVRQNSLPAPEVYNITKDDEGGWVVMECLPGTVASEIWEAASVSEKHTILTSSAILLKQIHDLEIPSFWKHKKHEVASQIEWIDWTKIRIQKYVSFAEQNLEKDLSDYLKVKFARLQDLYTSHPNFRFVSLHWDYHLSNINVDEQGEVVGVFDFDNAMKGHDMADIGQTVYWIINQQKTFDAEILKSLFKGYGNLTLVDLEFIELHFLLFLVGVMRSTWSKLDLKWLNELHVEVLKRSLKGEYSFVL